MSAGPEPADNGTAVTVDAPDAPLARAVALDLLREVLRRRKPLDEALAADERLTALEQRDRAFARLLVASVLRRLPQLDALIDRCLEKPLPDRAARVRDILRLGAVQLVVLGTPAHAAVGETVELAGSGHERRYRKLVNAVLRRLAEQGPAWAAAQDAGRLNTPDWMWASWQAAYGTDAASAIAAAHLEDPPLDLTVAADPDGWAATLGAEMLPTGSLRLRDAGPVPSLPGFDEGAWWVQDAAAALPVRLLGDLDGRAVADLCAAPGGKTAQLAAAGARVVAVDRSANRLRRVSENLGRLGLVAETVEADATSWRPAAPVDAVLLDAPCSATGTARRHPDILRLKTPGDVARLAALQDRLLAASVEMVKPGGLIVYCVCSLQPEEGPERIAALLDGSAAVERMPIDPSEVGGDPAFVTAQGELRTLPGQWPERGGLDGFYAARLRRI